MSEDTVTTETEGTESAGAVAVAERPAPPAAISEADRRRAEHRDRLWLPLLLPVGAILFVAFVVLEDLSFPDFIVDHDRKLAAEKALQELCEKELHDRPADPARAAGDDRHPAGEPIPHPATSACSRARLRPSSASKR